MTRGLLENFTEPACRCSPGRTLETLLGFPGFSLHDELALLVDSGMSPFAALQAATWNPAVFMEATDKYGAIHEGW